MSTVQVDEFDDRSSSRTSIKQERDSDDDLVTTAMNDTPANGYSQDNFLTNMNHSIPLVPGAYKGKIEVTSKGRRKIFDGVRWQILCRRPECRKQTNKKSLCITHYKEEYERHHSTSSWPEKVSSFEIFSYRRSPTVHDEQTDEYSRHSPNCFDETYRTPISGSSIHEGQIKFTHNGRRFILKNSKWHPLCKYDNICRSMAKYELLCIKHFQITQEKRRNSDTTSRPDRLSPLETEHRSTTEHRLVSSGSPFLDRFDIHGVHRNRMTTENTQHDASRRKLKNTGFEFLVSPIENSSSSTSGQIEQNEQSVQTDLTIPVCCEIYRKNHVLYSSCIYDNSTPSRTSHSTKDEPQYYHARYS